MSMSMGLNNNGQMGEIFLRSTRKCMECIYVNTCVLDKEDSQRCDGYKSDDLGIDEEIIIYEKYCEDESEDEDFGFMGYVDDEGVNDIDMILLKKRGIKNYYF